MLAEHDLGQEAVHSHDFIVSLHPSVLEGVTSVLPILDSHGLGRFEIEEKDELDSEHVRIRLHKHSGPQDPLEEVLALFQSAKITESNRDKQLGRLQERVGRKLREFVELKSDPRAQSLLTGLRVIG